MKNIAYLIFAVLIFLNYSCDEDQLIDPDKEEENLIIDDDTDAEKEEEEVIDYDIINSTELDFHNPSSITLVKVKGETAKKFAPIEDDNEYYYLYEIVNDSFQLVTAKDGHEVYFSGVGTVLKVNQEWQIISSLGELYPNDLTVYKVYEDTIITQFAETILFNVETGELYDLNVQIHFGIHEDSDNEPIYFDSKNNYLYFKKLFEQSFCRLNLNNLSLETFNLPYPMSTTDVWCFIDEMIFYTSTNIERKFLCYKPNIGYLTNTNIYDISLSTTIDTSDNPVDTSMNKKAISDNSIPSSIIQCHRGSNSPFFVFNYFSVSQEINFLKLIIRNDSMIFKFVTPTQLGYNPQPGYMNYLLGEGLRPIIHNNKKWYMNYKCLWSYNDEENIFSAISIDPMPTKIISDGENHFGLSGDIIYKYDLDALETAEFITINSTNLQIQDVYIGHESNLFVEGLRLSDLKDIVIEYDGVTGEKVSETISDEASPQSFITYLSPI